MNVGPLFSVVGLSEEVNVLLLSLHRDGDVLRSELVVSRVR